MRIRCLILISCLFVTGCVQQPQDPVEPIVLTINYPSRELFYSRYGLAFENSHPSIKINVVSDSSANPDIVFINNSDQYVTLAEKNELLDIGSFATPDQMQLLSPIVKRLLTNRTNGAYYGLSPTFHSKGLYYNKDLFDLHKVPYPGNGMSWTEIFELARQFPNYSDGERIYGFKSDYYREIEFALILRQGQTEGLTFINPETFALEMDKEQWLPIWHNVIDTFRAGSIYNVDDTQEPTSPLFTGQVAMEIESHVTAYNFDVFRDFIDGSDINWGLATVPVDPDRRGYSDSYAIYDIFAISKESKFAEEAWAFIEYVVFNSEHYMQNLGDMINTGLPAQIDALAKLDHGDLSPLYMLEPAETSYNPYDRMHHEIINSFKVAGQYEVLEAINGTITAEEAFDRLLETGQNVIHDAVLRIEPNKE